MDQSAPPATNTAPSTDASVFGVPFLADETKEEVTKQFFIFETDGELYAVPVEEAGQVLRIPPITSVPNAGAAVMGIFHLRGKVIVAVDLLKCLGLKRKGLFVTNYLFTTRRGKNDYAVLFDRPQTVFRIPAASIAPPDAMTAARIGERFIAGVFLYTSPRTHKKAAPDIMIEPGRGAGEPPSNVAPEEERERPVIILKLDEILADERVRADAPPPG